MRSRLYVDRARALGAGRGHLMRRHILPNVTPLILASTTLAVPISILTETTLSFLGLGDPTAGVVGVHAQRGAARRVPSAVVPGGSTCRRVSAIVLVVLAFTLLGRALETVLDPRLRER